MRSGLSPKEIGDDQKAPIFLQWLDTVQQLIYQFPSAFEFNMDFLLFIASHILSCLYGTFLYNSEFEREENNTKTNTRSIWTDVYLNGVNKYLNPYYVESSHVLRPSYGLNKMRFWEEYFLKWSDNINSNNRHYKFPEKYRK